MSFASELPNDPADLLDELDSIMREQEVLRRRTIALTARYRSLEGYADRFDKPGPTKWSRIEEYGSLNVEFSVKYLEDAAKNMAGVAKYGLDYARELAVKVREYPQPEREQGESDRGDR